MGQRLPELSQSWASLAAQGYDKQADAARIAAQGKAALGQGIANGLAQITTAMLRKKENARADSIRAEANARQDARDAKADERYNRSEARDLEKDQRSRDEFMLRYTEGKKGELVERIRAGDVTANEEFAQNERIAQTLTARLMAQQSNVMPNAGSRAPEMADVVRENGMGAAHGLDDSSVPPPKPADAKAPGCRKGEACDVAGPDKNAIDATATSAVSPAQVRSSALGSAMDAALAEREKRLQDHAKSDAAVGELEESLRVAKSRLDHSKTPVGVASAQGEIKDLTRRLSLARETAKIDAAHAVNASHEADQVAETQRAIEAQSRKSIETARNQMNDLRAFGGGDMSELVNGVDLNDEETRNQIDILHTKMMAGRTAAALKSEQEKFTPDYRRHLESQIEADPESGIEDASGLSQAELVAATKEYNARQRAHAAKAEKDRSFDLKKSNSEEANADRDATRSIVEKKYRDHLTTSIAELEGELAGMSKDDDNAAKKWSKLGALKAEKAELEKVGGGDAKAKARAEYDALPEDQKTPENAAKLLKKHGG